MAKVLSSDSTFGPVKFLDHGIERVGIGSRELVYGLEYAQRRAAAHVGAVEHGEVALERYHAASGFDILGAEAAKLFGKHFFKTP